MANFSTALARTLQFEGGYSNTPGDAGGETYKGIARNEHPEWDGWVIVDSLKAQSGFPGSLSGNLALQQSVNRFYQTKFWKYDNINDQEVANVLFDAGVNLNVPPAVKAMQTALKVFFSGPIVVDGIYGPKTEDFVNGAPTESLVAEFRTQWALHYVDIIVAKPADRQFGHSWFHRVVSV